MKCDVRVWKEQLAVFKAAIAMSPHSSVDIVIANAGIATDDPLYKLGMSRAIASFPFREALLG